MTLKEYTARLRWIWITGFVSLLVIMGGLRWQARLNGETAGRSLEMDILITVLIALVIPTLIVVRGYFRFKKWHREMSQPQA